MKKAILAILFALTSLAQAQYATLSGFVFASNGVAASNYTFSFTPSQWFYIAGTGVMVNTTTNCATSTDGTVVGIGNPLTATTATANFVGSLAPGNYYLYYTFYNSSGPVETLPSPEQAVQLSATGSIVVNPPASGIPSTVTGMRVYIGSSQGTETLQGSTTGSVNYTQSTSLASGASAPTTNSTICKQITNDAGWPTGTGYVVSLADSSGNVLPGYPMMWQLLGPNTTINLSSGLPYYHGTVIYPSPILATPFNHAAQSISGPLAFGGYNLLNLGRVGIGTSLPAWALDVVNGPANFSLGFELANTAVNNTIPVGNGTAYVASTPFLGTPAAAAQWVGVFSTTAATSDVFTLADGLTMSGHCFVQPTTTNTLTGIGCSVTGTNQVTVTHSATGGVQLNVFATKQ